MGFGDDSKTPETNNEKPTTSSDGLKAPEVSAFYQNYSAYKNWTNSNSHTSDKKEFSALIRELGITDPTTILEVGFGEGRFLDWARSEGHEITGLEILPEMVERAKARGHKVLLSGIEKSGLPNQHFQLIVAIDVAEHLSLAELVVFFESAERLLTQTGRIVLRFPNGTSPFFGINQYGDVTHKSSLSRKAIEQICSPLGFDVTRSIRLRIYPDGLIPNLRRRASIGLRAVIEIVVGYAFYGGRRNLDPNELLLISRRPAADPQDGMPIGNDSYKISLNQQTKET